ncbi:MAG: hypothetical protein ACMX3H_20170 [Sodalis sp. (in: enterobacteria)]
MKLKLNDVRLAFPALFEAKAVNAESEPRYSPLLSFWCQTIRLWQR